VPQVSEVHRGAQFVELRLLLSGNREASKKVQFGLNGVALGEWPPIGKGSCLPLRMAHINRQRDGGCLTGCLRQSEQRIESRRLRHSFEQIDKIRARLALKRFTVGRIRSRPNDFIESHFSVDNSGDT
jgi:hypothetical protein